MAEVEERRPSGSSGEAEELRRQLVDVHDQLVERDHEFRYWRDELRRKDEKIEALQRQNVDAEAQISELGEAIRKMEATRVWRIGLRYRSLRDSARRVLRRT